MNKFNKLKNEYMGPDYDYAKNVPNPKSLGISGDGSFSALINDITGLVKYVNILTFGDPPLGYNFFLRSGKCGNNKYGKSCSGKPNTCVNRYIYVRNIPTGNIPGLSDMGMGKTSFKGLVPGLAEDVGDLTEIPVKIWDNLSGKGTNPPNKCKLVTRTVGPNGNTRSVSRWVPIIEPFSNNSNFYLISAFIFFFIIYFFFK
jgi:hypothetical protein